MILDWVFIMTAFIECALCARHCASTVGRRDGVPALPDLII